MSIKYKTNLNNTKTYRGGANFQENNQGMIEASVAATIASISSLENSKLNTPDLDILRIINKILGENHLDYGTILNRYAKFKSTSENEIKQIIIKHLNQFGYNLLFETFTYQQITSICNYLLQFPEINIQQNPLLVGQNIPQDVNIPPVINVRQPVNVGNEDNQDVVSAVTASISALVDIENEEAEREEELIRAAEQVLRAAEQELRDATAEEERAKVQSVIKVQSIIRQRAAKVEAARVAEEARQTAARVEAARLAEEERQTAARVAEEARQAAARVEEARLQAEEVARKAAEEARLQAERQEHIQKLLRAQYEESERQIARQIAEEAERASRNAEESKRETEEAAAIIQAAQEERHAAEAVERASKEAYVAAELSRQAAEKAKSEAEKATRASTTETIELALKAAEEERKVASEASEKARQAAEIAKSEAEREKERQAAEKLQPRQKQRLSVGRRPKPPDYTILLAESLGTNNSKTDIVGKINTGTRVNYLQYLSSIVSNALELSRDLLKRKTELLERKEKNTKSVRDRDIEQLHTIISKLEEEVETKRQEMKINSNTNSSQYKNPVDIARKHKFFIKLPINPKLENFKIFSDGFYLFGEIIRLEKILFEKKRKGIDISRYIPDFEKLRIAENKDELDLNEISRLIENIKGTLNTNITFVGIDPNTKVFVPPPTFNSKRALVDFKTSLEEPVQLIAEELAQSTRKVPTVRGQKVDLKLQQKSRRDLSINRPDQEEQQLSPEHYKQRMQSISQQVPQGKVVQPKPQGLKPRGKEVRQQPISEVDQPREELFIQQRDSIARSEDARQAAAKVEEDSRQAAEGRETILRRGAERRNPRGTSLNRVPNLTPSERQNPRGISLNRGPNLTPSERQNPRGISLNEENNNEANRVRVFPFSLENNNRSQGSVIRNTSLNTRLRVKNMEEETKKLQAQTTARETDLSRRKSEQLGRRSVLNLATRASLLHKKFEENEEQEKQAQENAEKQAQEKKYLRQIELHGDTEKAIPIDTKQLQSFVPAPSKGNQSKRVANARRRASQNSRRRASQNS